ncbi:MAG TPA: adenylyl-sulfate kinase [Candidatus Acidoferrum sp.]|nr:adenylyl-sulfate kinase [Candidatus Acidoferrum sp.]
MARVADTSIPSPPGTVAGRPEEQGAAIALARRRPGLTIWLTGLPSAGKSTIAQELAKRLEAHEYPVGVLDGDEFRLRLSRGLGFSRLDRDEHIRRVAYVARLLASAGAFAIVAAISPYRSERDEARVEIERFIEVYVNCPVEECIKRDVKGLYQKALSGEISNFTGVSDPYEAPLHPEVIVDTHRECLEESVGKILRALPAFGYPLLDGGDGMSADEREQIREKLRALGYLE